MGSPEAFGDMFYNMYIYIYRFACIHIYIYICINTYVLVYILLFTPFRCLPFSTLCRPSDPKIQPKIQVYRSCFVGRLMMEMLDRQSNVVAVVVVVVVVVVVGFIMAGQPNPPPKKNKAL